VYDPPCGYGACCHANGSCTDELTAGCQAAGDDFRLGGKCVTSSCPASNACSYNTGASGNTGFGNAQYAPDNGRWLEFAENFYLPGTGTCTVTQTQICRVNADCPEGTCSVTTTTACHIGADCPQGETCVGGEQCDLNPCIVESITYMTFNTGHDTANGCALGGGPNCADDPSDFQGIVVTISNDADEVNPALVTKGPTCLPNYPVEIGDPATPWHHSSDPQHPEYCKHVFEFGVVSQDPPLTGNYWDFTTEIIGQAQYTITLHFNPPLLLEKNKKNWVGIVPRMPRAEHYSNVWFGTDGPYDMNVPRAWDSVGTQTFDPANFSPLRDLVLRINGSKNIGCGHCALYGDLVLPFCLVDVDDLIKVLDEFSAPIQDPIADISPCPAGSGGGVVDVDDLIGVLDAFAGTNDCPEDTCAPGACILPSTECRDGSYFDNGMSQSTCVLLSGLWCGNNTICGDPCPAPLVGCLFFPHQVRWL
jgi:hypothetical protein